MRLCATSLQRSAKTLRQSWLRVTGKMTTCICWLNTRRKWRFPIWLTASRAFPRVVSGNSIPTLLCGTTRAFCGLRVTLLPHVEAHRCPAFVSTLKSNGKTCECFALNLLYPRPQRRGFTRYSIRGVRDNRKVRDEAVAVVARVMPIEQMQKFLEHAQLETTQLYAEASTERLR